MKHFNSTATALQNGFLSNHAVRLRLRDLDDVINGVSPDMAVVLVERDGIYVALRYFSPESTQMVEEVVVTPRPFVLDPPPPPFPVRGSSKFRSRILEDDLIPFEANLVAIATKFRQSCLARDKRARARAHA